ncbi:hypothetical protein CCH79_00008433, partial [Gambusia affinis]
MELMKIALSLPILLCPAWALSHHSYLDGMLSPRSAMQRGVVPALRFLDEALRFDPCCLMSPPPPPLFPPPPRLWKRGTPDTLSLLEPTVFGGEGTDDTHVTPECSPGPPGPPGPQGEIGLPGIRGPKGRKVEKLDVRGQGAVLALPVLQGLQDFQDFLDHKDPKGKRETQDSWVYQGCEVHREQRVYLVTKVTRGTEATVALEDQKGTRVRRAQRENQVFLGREDQLGDQGKEANRVSKDIQGPQASWDPQGLQVPMASLAHLGLQHQKGEKGLPGPPGHCDCDTVIGSNNAPFGNYYTTRRGGNKLTAVRLWVLTIFVVNSEEEMSRLHVENVIVLRKDKRMLYYKDKDGWSPIQPFQPFQSTETVPERVGVCGDGTVQVQHGEECDDGNQVVTDACLS